MPSARGLTMHKITNVRLALQQICADERDRRTMTARIMAERNITTDDVLAACDVVQDVIAEHHNAEQVAASHG